jgi:hypothetical protein
MVENSVKSQNEKKGERKKAPKIEFSFPELDFPF